MEKYRVLEIIFKSSKIRNLAIKTQKTRNFVHYGGKNHQKFNTSEEFLNLLKISEISQNIPFSLLTHTLKFFFFFFFPPVCV
jgi:hypothetical protein